MPEPTLVDRLDELDAAVDEVSEAAESAEGYADLIDQLDDLSSRIEAARSDPNALDANTYADLALDMMLLVPNELPLPEASKKLVEAVAAGVGAFIQGATSMSLTLAGRSFRTQLQAMSPEEAARLATVDPTTQKWLLAQYRLGKLTLQGDTRETESSSSWLWTKLKNLFTFWSPLWAGVVILPVVALLLLGPLGLFAGDDDGAAPSTSPTEVAAALTEVPAEGASATSTPVPSDQPVGCGGIGTAAYLPIPPSEQTVPGTDSIPESVGYASVAAGLSICVGIPPAADHQAVIAGGGYFLTTITLAVNNELLELTVSKGDGIAPFGRRVQRAGAVELQQFALPGSEVADNAAIVLIPATIEGGEILVQIEGVSSGLLEFLGVGAATYSAAGDIEPYWAGTVAADVPALSRELASR
jgi:hypothetical protein